METLSIATAPIAYCIKGDPLLINGPFYSRGWIVEVRTSVRSSNIISNATIPHPEERGQTSTEQKLTEVWLEALERY